jgi:hypothetical protein
MSVHFS